MELGVVGDRAVVGPAVGSGGLHRAIDATEFTNPQVYVDAQCRPTDLGAHMRQHREQVLEVADSLRLDAGGVAFTDGRWEHPLGESGQQHRVDGAAQYLGDERMPLELIEHRCGVEGVGNIREQGSEDRFRDGGVVARLVVGGHDRIECIRQHRYDAVKLVVALPVRASNHASGARRVSPITASAPNSSPNTVWAKSIIAVGAAPEPKVAEVATGVIFPSGRARSLSDTREASFQWLLRVRPRRRNSIATSVPCAPS